MLEPDLTGVRGEVAAAIAVTEGETRGLATIRASSITAETAQRVGDAFNRMQVRLSRLQAVLTAIDTLAQEWADLIADGYPSTPPFVVPGDVSADLASERSDLIAALDLFRDAEASTVTITMSQPEDK